MLHRAKQFGTGYSTNGRHYITLNGEMLAQSCSQILTYPILKSKGKLKLLPFSISVMEVRTPEILDSNNINKVDFNTFQLPEGIISTRCNASHGSQHAKNVESSILNTNNTISSLAKNSPIVTLVPAGKWEEIQEIKWSVLQDTK